MRSPICTPDDPFGRGPRRPPGTTLRADDGRSRTEAEFRRDQARSDYEAVRAMYGPMADATAFSRGLRVIAGGFELMDLIADGTDAAAAGRLQSLGIEILVDAGVRKAGLPEDVGDAMAGAVDVVIREGGGMLVDAFRDRLEARRDAADEARVREAIDRQEHRERTAPGEMIA